jgi:hypothetical protein
MFSVDRRELMRAPTARAGAKQELGFARRIVAHDAGNIATEVVSAKPLTSTRCLMVFGISHARLFGRQYRDVCRNRLYTHKVGLPLLPAQSRKRFTQVRLSTGRVPKSTIQDRFHCCPHNDAASK